MKILYFFLVGILLSDLVLPQEAYLYKQFEGHKTELYRVRFSPNNNYLATVGIEQNQRLKLWEFDTGNVLIDYEYTAGWGGIEDLAFSKDGKYLAAIMGYSIVLWDLATFEIVQKFGADLWSCQFSPDGKYIISEYGNEILVFSIESEEIIRRFVGEREDVHFKHDVTNDGEYLATSGYKKIIKIWDFSTGKLKHTYKTNYTGIGGPAIKFSNDNKKLAIALNGKIEIMDVAKGKIIKNIKTKETPYSVYFTNDDKYVISWDPYTNIMMWDCNSGKLKTHLLNKSDPYPIAISSDSKFIATCTEEGTIDIYKTGFEKSK